MNKIFHSWKLECYLMLRNKWTYVLSLFLVIMSLIQYIDRLTRADPGNAITSTAFIIQGGIFASILFGATIVKAEKKAHLHEVVFSIKGSIQATVFGKLLTCITFAFLATLLSLLALYFTYYYYGLPQRILLDFDIVRYYILYFALPWIIASIIGLILGTYIQSRLIYPAIFIIGILIGPINYPLIEKTSLITHYNFMIWSDFFNLGQSNPHAPYNPVYGLPLESKRWIQKAIWLTGTLGLLLALFIRQNKIKNYLWVFVVSCIFMAPLIYIYNQDTQVPETSYKPNSVNYYDANYYSSNILKQKDSIKNENFIINQYNIKLDIGRNMKVKATVSIKTIESLNDLEFTLYHGFKIKKVYTSKGKSLKFTQNGDFLNVKLSNTLAPGSNLNLVIDYEGVSSPYFVANEQAVLLPNYFPWLPVTGKHQIMKNSDGMLVRTPLQPHNQMKYVIDYNGPEPLYSNLNRHNQRLEGTVENGVTLISGKMTSTKIDDKLVYYPDSLYNMINKVPSYLKTRDSFAAKIQGDLGINKNTSPNVIFFVTTPVESFDFPLTSWSFNDHMIVSVEQLFNESNIDFLNMSQFQILTSVLLDSTRSEYFIEEERLMQQLFILGYTQWYGISNPKIFEGEKESPMQGFKRLFQSLKGSEYQQHVKNIESLENFVVANQNNPEKLRKFFYTWNEYMQAPGQTSWDIIEVLMNKM